MLKQGAELGGPANPTVSCGGFAGPPNSTPDYCTDSGPTTILSVGRHTLRLEFVFQDLVDLPGVCLPFGLLHDLADKKAD